MHNIRGIQMRIAVLGLSLAWCFSSPSTGIAQELEPLQLLFVDSGGAPIAGVEANPGSFVYQGKSSASFAVNNLRTSDGGKLISNDAGGMEIPVPDKGHGELVRLKLNAKHPFYAELTDWVQVNIGDATKIELARGVRIAVTAVEEETHHPIQHGLFAIAEQKDLDQMIDWKSNGKGMLLSRRLRVSDKRIRLVQILDGNAVRFSDPIDVEKADGERTFVREVAMTKALQLSGCLDESVPRPIRDGLVSLCISWPTQTEREETGPVGHWLAHAEIGKDGTFHIYGLPAGSWIQVIASCKGWYSNPSDRKGS